MPQNKKTRDRQIALGLCIMCKDVPIEGQQKCEKCREKATRRWRERYHKQKSAGFCSRCLMRKVDSGHLCSHCAPNGPNAHPGLTTERARWLYRAYAITEEDWTRMYEEQGKSCASCNVTNIRLVVDHDHASGVVRALLCYSCNAICGVLEKSNVRDCINYLNAWKEVLT